MTPNGPATEDDHRMALNASRNAMPGGAPQTSPPASQGDGTTSLEWGLLFGAAGIVWLIGLLADLLVPLITVVINYLTVLGLWIFAKCRGLKPPTFSTAKKGVAAAAKVKMDGAGGGAGAADALESVPGSDLVYVLCGGITPLIYLSALWWNNH